ncbi:hypothetical protein ASE63_13725 [Bosea sp. Root381]|nr:hypothetical protein ASE63_13725 [Bosea sp. Root381]
MPLIRIALAMLLGLPLLAGPADAADPPALAPLGGILSSGQGFTFASKQNKTRRSLSGIACPSLPKAPGFCLAVFDEGGEARYLTLGKEGLRPDAERVGVLPGTVELDGEGAATDGRFYYVVGSHSAKRGDCASNPGSRHLIRFPIDPATGRGKLAELVDTGALWTLMAGIPGLKKHVGEAMCLGSEPPEDAPHLPGRRGVNIEGLAVKDGRLFVGFRGPAKDGQARILSVDADALFAGGDPRARLFSVAVGAGRAVRDLVAASDGILVLAGPDDDKSNEKRGFTVLRWNAKDGSDNVRPLASLDLRGVKLRGCDEEIKPEAITLLADRPGEPYDAVILSDGLCDGGPLRFAIPR